MCAHKVNKRLSISIYTLLDQSKPATEHDARKTLQDPKVSPALAQSQ